MGELDDPACPAGVHQPTAVALQINGEACEPADGGQMEHLAEEQGADKKLVLDTTTYLGRIRGLHRS